MSDELDLSEEVLFGMEEHDEGEKAGRSVDELEREDLSGTDREKQDSRNERRTPENCVASRRSTTAAAQDTARVKHAWLTDPLPTCFFTAVKTGPSLGSLEKVNQRLVLCRRKGLHQ